MNSATRVLALTLIAALLFVPALTRVHQRLEHASTSTLISSYSRSAEAPPDKLLGAPPPIVVTLVVDLVRIPIITSWQPVTSDLLPFFPTAPPDALRAPPLA